MQGRAHVVKGKPGGKHVGHAWIQYIPTHPHPPASSLPEHAPPTERRWVPAGSEATDTAQHSRPAQQQEGGGGSGVPVGGGGDAPMHGGLGSPCRRPFMAPAASTAAAPACLRVQPYVHSQRRGQHVHVQRIAHSSSLRQRGFFCVRRMRSRMCSAAGSTTTRRWRFACTTNPTTSKGAEANSCSCGTAGAPPRRLAWKKWLKRVSVWEWSCGGAAVDQSIKGRGTVQTVRHRAEGPPAGMGAPAPRAAAHNRRAPAFSSAPASPPSRMPPFGPIQHAAAPVLSTRLPSEPTPRMSWVMVGGGSAADSGGSTAPAIAVCAMIAGGVTSRVAGVCCVQGREGSCKSSMDRGPERAKCRSAAAAPLAASAGIGCCAAPLRQPGEPPPCTASALSCCSPPAALPCHRKHGRGRWAAGRW